MTTMEERWYLRTDSQKWKQEKANLSFLLVCRFTLLCSVMKLTALVIQKFWAKEMNKISPSYSKCVEWNTKLTMIFSKMSLEIYSTRKVIRVHKSLKIQSKLRYLRSRKVSDLWSLIFSKILQKNSQILAEKKGNKWIFLSLIKSMYFLIETILEIHSINQ